MLLNDLITQIMAVGTTANDYKITLDDGTPVVQLLINDEHHRIIMSTEPLIEKANDILASQEQLAQAKREKILEGLVDANGNYELF